MAFQMICSSIILLIFVTIPPLTEAILDPHYYDKPCPQAENIVSQTIRNASTFDPKVPARILRMFFHDCFIRVPSLSLSPRALRKVVFDSRARDNFINKALCGCHTMLTTVS